MSGPKGGTAAVGGAGAAVLGAGAIATVALPAIAVGLVGYGLYKAGEAGVRAANRAVEEHQKHKNDMLAEITYAETPLKSLLSNAENRWKNEKGALDSLWQKVQRELTALQAADAPQTKKEAEESYKLAASLVDEAEGRYAQFQKENQTSSEKFAEARKKKGSSQRTVRSIISEGRNSADKAVGTINAATESARLAQLRLEDTLAIIQKKGAEERKREAARRNAESNITAAKNEITEDNLMLIAEWKGEEPVKLIREYLAQADSLHQSQQFDKAALSAQESVAMYRQFYTDAMRIKTDFTNREIITDAIVAALTELQYDEPDVNYEAKADSDNALLGNLTIFAKSKGETGDMRMVIGLDGKLDIDSDVPEGKENECHQLLTDLQAKVGETVDFNITDWGRAKNYRPEEKGGIPKQQVRVQEQVKQRGI